MSQRQTHDRPAVAVVVVIPVGPNCLPDYIADTLESFYHYTGPSRHVILIDDSGRNTCAQFRGRWPDIEILATPKVLGFGGGLYASLSNAYHHALQTIDFRVLIRLDTDALIIGPRPEDDMAGHFAQHPDVAMVGEHLHTRDGRAHNQWSRAEIAKELSWRMARHDPRRWWLMRRLVSRALRHGYEVGEFVRGGAYGMSPVFIRRLRDAGFLPHDGLRKLWLEEDHIYALLAASLGMRMGDMGPRADGCFSASLKMLDYSPTELVERGVKIIHSTRGWADTNEDGIRHYFRERRRTEIVNAKAGAA